MAVQQLKYLWTELYNYSRTWFTLVLLKKHVQSASLTSSEISLFSHEVLLEKTEIKRFRERCFTTQEHVQQKL